MLKRKTNGAWSDVGTLKKKINGAWIDCSFCKKKVSGAWSIVWPVKWLGFVDASNTYGYGTITSSYLKVNSTSGGGLGRIISSDSIFISAGQTFQVNVSDTTGTSGNNWDISVRTADYSKIYYALDTGNLPPAGLYTGIVQNDGNYIFSMSVNNSGASMTINSIKINGNQVFP